MKIDGGAGSEQRNGSLAGVKLLVDGPDGSELVDVPAAIAAAFQPGDRLLVTAGREFLHIPGREAERAREAVDRAAAAFTQMSRISPEQTTQFYRAFASALEDDSIWKIIRAANEDDVARARERGRSTTRLAASEPMRRDMARGLREWGAMPSPIGRVLETTVHHGWKVDQVYSPLGVVAFVFEGRPNVFADATGVLRSGNTTVMRIGSDALGTASAILTHALLPSLRDAGLPEGAVSLVQSRDHAAGWALFSDRRIALAVARGSGPATRQLGAAARLAGIPVSLHGAGGAWLAADLTANSERFYQTVFHSLDRKVCNTLNTLCLTRDAAPTLAPLLMKALWARAEADGSGFRLHVTPTGRPWIPAELFKTPMRVHRPEGVRDETAATPLPENEIGREWEWEKTPEMSLTVAGDLEEAAALFNRYSPQFVASLISEDAAAQDFFYGATNAPFVGDGFTRWVDGQFALSRPELGLSNWESGRLLGRSGILSGDGIYTVRLRAYQEDPELHR
ncbi:MAG: aldehyde dehydrogenase family protein [Chloroflexi bacterium]|nr:aldehyde dehydrogenase family protein [Chloroflexota bacterium]